MARYIIRRLLWAIVLLLSVTVVTYVIFYLIPADPARLAAGRNPTPAQVKSARRSLGARPKSRVIAKQVSKRGSGKSAAASKRGKRASA